MILFLGRYLIGVLECHQLTPPNKIVLFLAKHLPPIYDRRHYLHCTISLIMKKISEPTSSNSHLTRNEKWKLWVGWHGSFCWLLCLCVLCFVFCAVSKTIRCSQVSPISISKNENYDDKFDNEKNSEPTSSNSHLKRNEKWKLWVEWHGSSCWLLCLYVLFFVFCAVSTTIWCS
jgi:thiosulfate reductase cytochrome b subunit